MPSQKTIYRVLIASPSDVKRDRDVVDAAIHAWNTEHSADRTVMFQPVRWESASPRQGSTAQEVINSDQVATCDLLIGVFWTRLGTPTGKDRSGTIEEIRQFAHDDRPAGLFFKTANMPIKHDPEEYRLLREFQAEVRDPNSNFRGLAVEFRTSPDLRAAVGRFLTETLRRLQGSAAAAAVEAASESATPPGIAHVEEDLDEEPGLLEILPIVQEATSDIWTRLGAMDQTASTFRLGPAVIAAVMPSTSQKSELEAAGDLFADYAKWLARAASEMEVHVPELRSSWARLRASDILFAQLLPTDTPEDRQRARDLLATIPGLQDHLVIMPTQLATARAGLQAYRGKSAELNRAVKRMDRALVDLTETVAEGHATAQHLVQILNDRLRREQSGD